MRSFESIVLDAEINGDEYSTTTTAAQISKVLRSLI
jgi:hypothetical protein